MDTRNLDWKLFPSTLKFPYNGDITNNKKYLKDRETLFAKSGNGWWWYTYDHQNPYRITKKQKRRYNNGCK